ncbi:MAG: hypothetical protein R3E50_17215 [Halioglobus sp.]
MCKHRALDKMVIPHQCIFHRKELFTQSGLFKTEFRICGDFELILREIVTGSIPVFIPNLIIAGKTIGGMSTAHENAPVLIQELKRARTLNDLPSYSVNLLLRQLRWVFRNYLHRIFGKKITHPLLDFYRQLLGKPKLWTRKD